MAFNFQVELLDWQHAMRSGVFGDYRYSILREPAGDLNALSLGFTIGN